MMSQSGFQADASQHEESPIRSFVQPQRQDRLLSFLRNPRQREKICRSLDHFPYLDPRFAQAVPAPLQNPADIATLLKAKGAPDQCHVISADKDLDGQQMALIDALRAVVGQGRGTFLSSIRGHLAYFEAEGPGERYVLERQ